MARPLRIEYAGAWYHVMARGNQGHWNQLRPAQSEKINVYQFPRTDPIVTPLTLLLTLLLL
jgi:hypothetical protein